MKRTPRIRTIKNELLALAQAFDDPARIQLFLQLARKPQHVEALAAKASLSRPTISYHLAVLLRAGAVTLERRGRTSIYSANLAATKDRLKTLAAEIDALQ